MLVCDSGNVANGMCLAWQQEANETCNQSAETLGNTESTHSTETNLLEKVNQNLREDTEGHVLSEKMDTGLPEKSVEVLSLEKIVSSDFPENMAIADSPEVIRDKVTNSDSPDEVLTEPAQMVQAISMVTEDACTLDEVVKVIKLLI